MLNIDKVRQEKNLGFLPDNQQWKYLNEMLDNDRFVMAALAGHLSTKFLALAAEDELQRRAATLDDFTEDEFQERMLRLVRHRPEVVTPTRRL